LSLYVFSNNKVFVKNVINKIQAGGISVNDTISHFVPESFPFGGIKTSGIGRYHGRYSFETFSHFKPVFFRGKFEINVKYPPYKGFEKIQKMLRKWYL
jgi:aldehyde dehydrogenase (NAD+)